MERKFVQNNKRGSKLNFIKKTQCNWSCIKIQMRKEMQAIKGTKTISCKLEI